MQTANRSDHEVVVVGGQVAGSAAALLFADPAGAAEVLL
jgi:flavin-dependent dehydrogenase